MLNKSTERRIQIGIEIWLGNGEFRKVIIKTGAASWEDNSWRENFPLNFRGDNRT
jgi:hypothetical protein